MPSRPLLLAIALTLAGCGGDEGGLVVELSPTFHQDEEPVQVTRIVQLPADEGPPSRELLVELSIRALLAGPSDEERSRGIHSFFSAETEGLLRGVSMEGDTAIVDLTGLADRLPNASSSAGSGLLITQLDRTVFTVPGVAAARYEWDGSCERFWEFLQRDCRLSYR